MSFKDIRLVGGDSGGMVVSFDTSQGELIHMPKAPGLPVSSFKGDDAARADEVEDQRTETYRIHRINYSLSPRAQPQYFASLEGETLAGVMDILWDGYQATAQPGGNGNPAQPNPHKGR